MAKTVAQKLSEVDTRLRRWETKLTRAANEVTKLSKQRRRLATLVGAAIQDGKVLPVKTEAVIEKVEADLDLPKVLDRRVNAEAMTAARKAAEAEARKKMPLSGRDALRMLSAKVTEKRERKGRTA